MSTLATPSSPSSSGLISVCAMRAASARPSWDVAAIEAMITGEALMLSALTCGLTPLGRPAAWMFCSIWARTSLTSVP